jgi:hypothetical protein
MYQIRINKLIKKLIRISFLAAYVTLQKQILTIQRLLLLSLSIQLSHRLTTHHITGHPTVAGRSSYRLTLRFLSTW